MDYKRTACVCFIFTIWKAVSIANKGSNFINCPQPSRVIQWEVESENASTPIEYGVIDNDKVLLLGLVLRTNVDSKISYNPPTGTYFANKSSVGRSYLVEATATNEAHNTATCRFLIHVTAHCKPWTLRTPRNGVKTCSNSSSGWTCRFSCLPGHVFYKEAWPVNLTCAHGQAGWTPARGVPNCIVYGNANYSLTVGFTYYPTDGSAINGTLCESAYQAAFLKAFSDVSKALTDQCRTQLDDPSPGRFVKLHEEFLQMRIKRNQVSINTTVFIRPNNLTDTELISCGGLSMFHLYVVTLYKSTKPLRAVTPGSAVCPALKTNESGVLQRKPHFRCHNNHDVLIQSQNQHVCLPCPSGYFSNDNDTACEPCARGHYQSADGQQECARCPNGTWTRHEASTSSAECQDVCPPGFFSHTSLPPCKRCPVDTYSSSPSVCSDCSNGKSTVGIDGAFDVSACKECLDGPCQNGGTCVGFGDVTRCVCTAAYTGRTCEKRATVSCAGDPAMKCAALPISAVKITTP